MKFRLRLLLAAFAVSFLLVCLLSGISFSRFSRLGRQVTAVEHSYQVANLINILDEKLLELDKNEFRFLVTGDSVFFHGYEQTVPLLRTISDSLKELTKDNRDQQHLLILFESDLALYLDASRRSMRLAISTPNIHTSAPYQNSRALMATASRRLSMMSAAEDTLLKDRTAERKSYEALTSAMIKTLGILFSVLTLLLFFMLLNEFRRRVRIQAELQQTMMEIGQSKQELEHIAYATSHDLQEPLRKIRILTDKWKHQQKAEAPEGDTKDTLDRVAAAATRMQELVGELMTLTTLNVGRAPVPCPLQVYVRYASTALSRPIEEKDARITVDTLPEIDGYPDQLKLLFRHLIDNALKFARPGVPPEIHISMRMANSDEVNAEIQTDLRYYCILIEDNGIGFDNKMADKMFGIFRQLHTVQEGYAGKGTGLAICRRIMTNHKGHIIAHGFPDAGATFKLYFPA